MTALASLTTDKWTVVARWVRDNDKHDRWEWTLPPQDVDVLQIAIAHGSAKVHQTRAANGDLVKVARLEREQREGLEFAVAGRGMFEQ